MKKKFAITAAALCMLFFRSEAQKAYVRIGGGYNAANAGQTLNANGYPINGMENINYFDNYKTVNVKKASFAAGATANIAVGYMLSNIIGVELSGVIGVAPAKYTADIIYNATGAPASNTITFKQNAKMPVLLIPSLVLQSGTKINLYMRAGLVLPVSTTIVQKESRTVQGVALPEAISTIHSGFKLGLAGAAGVSYPVAKNLKVFVEADLLSMSQYTKKVDSASTTTSYKSKLSINATDRTTYANPFSAIGGSAGIQLAF